jgi:hypothetical protein
MHHHATSRWTICLALRAALALALLGHAGCDASTIDDLPEETGAIDEHAGEQILGAESTAEVPDEEPIEDRALSHWDAAAALGTCVVNGACGPSISPKCCTGICNATLDRCACRLIDSPCSENRNCCSLYCRGAICHR